MRGRVTDIICALRPKNSGENCALQLYLSLIRPHLEYACPVWDSHTMKDKVLLEKFALRMATKQWDSGYQELLDIMNVPSLADRRLQLKLALLYKIVHGMCYFPSDILCTLTNYSLRTNHSLVLDQPYARANAYFYSFVPHTISTVEIVYSNLPSSLFCLQLLLSK